MSRIRALLILLLACGSPGVASAHALAPSVLTIAPEGEGRVSVHWRYSLRDPGAAELQPVFPQACARLEGPLTVPAEAGVTVQRWRFDCSTAGPEARLRIAGLANGPRSVLLRHEDEAGAVTTRLLDGERVAGPLWPGSAPPRLDTARAYAVMGIEHLLLGPDHLLFVIGLFLLVRAPRRLLLLSLGFTLGHSLTLAASVLGHLRLPQALAEWGIAASIVWLGWHVVRRTMQATGAQPKEPGLSGLMLAATGFGLLHGLGFAGALQEIGLPQHALWLALLAFNIGIEWAQLLVLAALFALAAALRRASIGLPESSVPAAYLIGGIGAYWLIDRSLVILS